jgi:peptidoglycan/LPS O-acetylase OafA/YrhL
LLAHAPALDGLRGIAILLVLFHHYFVLRPVTSLDESLAQGPYVGWAGVDLFFVLSGFLITGILIDARGSDRYFTSFYARRTLRIFPLYYLVAFLSLVVLPGFPFAYDLLVGPGAPREQWPYWLYLTNFAVADRDRFIHGILDVTWSLAIEEQFYLVWAVVVWLCPIRLLGALCAAVIVAVAGGRVWAVAAGATPIDVYVLTLYRADGLATGALIAWAVRHGWLTGAGGISLGLSAVTALGVVAVSWLDGESWWWGPAMQKMGYSLLAITGGAWIVAAIRLPETHWWPRVLSAAWLRSFGKYSYCLYLIHLPIMRSVREFVLGPEQFVQFGWPWIGQLVFYGVTTAAAYAVAWTSWRVFEAPILRLKSRFPY